MAIAGKAAAIPKAAGTTAAAALGGEPVPGKVPGRRHFQPAVRGRSRPSAPGPGRAEPRPPAGPGERGRLPAAPLRDEPGAAPGGSECLVRAELPWPGARRARLGSLLPGLVRHGEKRVCGELRKAALVRPSPGSAGESGVTARASRPPLS